MLRFLLGAVTRDQARAAARAEAERRGWPWTEPVTVMRWLRSFEVTTVPDDDHLYAELDVDARTGAVVRARLVNARGHALVARRDPPAWVIAVVDELVADLVRGDFDALALDGRVPAAELAATVRRFGRPIRPMSDRAPAGITLPFFRGSRAHLARFPVVVEVPADGESAERLVLYLHAEVVDRMRALRIDALRIEGGMADERGVPTATLRR